MFRLRPLHGLFLALVAFSAPLAAGTDPLAEIARQSADYARELAREVGGGYLQEERHTLREAADLLARRGRCASAVDLARQALAGVPAPGFADWFRLAASAHCAKRWHDAVQAADLAYRNAADDGQRQSAASLLGRSLEAHWSHGSAEALAAYRLALKHGSDPKIVASAKRLEQRLAQEQALRVERHYVELDGKQPALCLDFNRDMPGPHQQAYRDFIRFEPAFDALFSRAGSNRICAEGAAYGSDYRVRLLPGLSAEDGKKLAKARDIAMQVRDREPALWFANSRYVLPPGGGVPLHAMNLPKAKLTLYRVDERNLLNPEMLRRFRGDLSPYQAREIRDSLGEQIWQGEAELAVRRNAEAITRLPIAELARPTPGVYVLSAEQPDREENGGGELAAQWLVVSDLGLTSYRGKDGMTVQVRGLTDAMPRTGVRVKLHGRNNALLAEGSSDSDGLLRFPASALGDRGGREPAMLMAFGADGDFNFFDIGVSPYDLSDRGVAGRPVPGPLDAFLYTERGVYRPGETVNLAVLLRDDRGRAVDGLPLNLRLLRPDEQLAFEGVIHPVGGGGYATALPISSSARTGRWKLLAYLDKKAEPVGSTGFLVEAILPPRIEVDVTQAPEQPLRPDAEGRFSVQARYLFGAPGADLGARAELRVEADPDPFPQFPGYRFGPVDEPEDSVLLPLAAARTDAGGNVEFPFRLDRLPKLRRPLRARLWAEVSDVDGRAVSAARWLPVRHQPFSLGIKPPGEGGAVQLGSEGVFQVLALDPQGQPSARGGLLYRLLREDKHYQWYKDGGRWHYKAQTRDRLLDEGALAVGNDAPARLAFPLDYGSYRLELSDPATGVSSSVRVHSGWAGGDGDPDTPDRIGMQRDRDTYRPGETARLQLQAPFSGPATLVIAGDRVLSVRNLLIEDKAQSLDLTVGDDWGAGAYALLTAYRPDGGAEGHGPRRAVGVVWLGIDKGLHRLAVDIRAPDKTLPRQRQAVELRVSGQRPDEPVFLTLAAVDEGVLRLTDYGNPDPLGHYFGQRRLGVGLRDLYGRLIDGHAGTPGRIRSGAGASGRRGMPDDNVQIVSLFSGIVPVDAAGRASVPLDLPDFNGKLRLMAVAWSGQRLGSAGGELTVRDPVVVQASLPRFMAAGDRSRAGVLLHNMEGAEGEYRLSWELNGAVEPAEGAAHTLLELARGQRAQIAIPILADTVGSGHLRLELQGPDGSRLVKQSGIGVRAPFLPETRRKLGRLRSGESVALGPRLSAGLRPETLEGQLTVGNTPNLDVPGLLRQLDLYPYGCLEQVTSRAFPLLHLEQLAERWNYQSRTPVGERLTDAVSRVLDKQLDNGAFSLWNPGAGQDSWVSAYALDFLQRARAAGVEVPDYAWERGLEWLRRQVTYPEIQDSGVMAVQSYALYLLARQGETHAETARYLLDQGAEQLPGALAAAHLGAALGLMGDAERAARALNLARQRLGGEGSRDLGRGDYGSRLRDLAALVQILAEAGNPAAPDPAVLIQELAMDMQNNDWLSTQEQAWLVRAAAALSDDDAPLLLTLQGTELPARTSPLVLKPSISTLSAGLDLGNKGQGDAWYSLAVDGSPSRAPQSLSVGMQIRRSLLDMQGRPADPSALRQGDMLVVLLEGGALNPDLKHQALVVDPLPAGLEVENPRLAHARSAGELGWLGRLSDTLYSDALDDRFVAALDLGPGRDEFRIAYLVRAVAPGKYTAPPPQVEDMYKPAYRAVGESGVVTVGE